MMEPATPTYATLEEWIAREAVSCSPDDATLPAAIDLVLAKLGANVDLLGLGEPTHLVDAFLLLRNRVFEHLVAAHDYTAIAVESSFPRGHGVNRYINGHGLDSYDAVAEVGFSHNFGKLEPNRQLVEWMRHQNAGRGEHAKLRFYGFDAPTEMMFADSPRQLLDLSLEYLEAVDPVAAKPHRDRIEPLLGDDAAWSNQAAAMDPSQSIGGSPQATKLRIATKHLTTDLQTRRESLITASNEPRYLEAVHHAAHAQQMLSYHAAMARDNEKRTTDLLGLRDAMMADNLAYILATEKARGGKVLAFAHNQHLKRGKSSWQWGPQLLEWWPAGEHVGHMLGDRYAVIGMGVGTSETMNLEKAEAGSLEAALLASPGPVRFLPTHRGQPLSGDAIDALVTRENPKSPGYFPFTPRDLRDFDVLAVLDEA